MTDDTWCYSQKSIKDLAWAVIQQASKDYEIALLKPIKAGKLGITSDDCYQFLTGGSETALMWFSAAELTPLSIKKPELEARILKDAKARSAKRDRGRKPDLDMAA